MRATLIRCKVECTGVNAFSERSVLTKGISIALAYHAYHNPPFVAIMMAPFVLEEEGWVTKVFNRVTRLLRESYSAMLRLTMLDADSGSSSVV